MINDQRLYERGMRFGLASLEEERWTEALSAFKIAAREAPADPAAQGGMGEALLGLERLEKALECFKQAANLSAGQPLYLQRVADVQERLGDLRAASRTYMAAGEILLRQRRLDDAVAHWERAVRLEPELLAAHRRLAAVYQAQGTHRKAIREYLAIARALQARGERQEARGVVRAALRLDPENADAREALALLEDTVRPSAEATPEEPQTLSERKISLATVRQVTEVLEAERLSPRMEAGKLDDPVRRAHRQAHEALTAEILREEGDPELLYGTGAGLSKLERDALIGRALDYEHRERFEEAVACYLEAFARDEQAPPAAEFVLGLLYLSLDEAEAARQALESTLEHPAYAEAAALLLSELGA